MVEKIVNVMQLRGLSDLDMWNNYMTQLYVPLALAMNHGKD